MRISLNYFKKYFTSKNALANIELMIFLANANFFFRNKSRISTNENQHFGEIHKIPFNLRTQLHVRHFFKNCGDFQYKIS